MLLTTYRPFSHFPRQITSEVRLSTQGRPSIGKRQKELSRLEKAREKAAERARRADERKNRPPGEPGVDPDIAGVVPGPQPPLDESGA